MSNQILARAAPIIEYFEYDPSRIPQGSREQQRIGAYEGGRQRAYFVIGTKFSNQSVNAIATADDLTQDEIARIISSKKPFFSKWAMDSPLLLHDKSVRFVYHTAARDSWESLPRDIRLGGPNLDFPTLGDLIDNLYGQDRSMDAIESVQQGLYGDDPTYFPDWWIKFGVIGTKSPKWSSSNGCQEKYTETLNRTFKTDALLFVLKIYGYKTEVPLSDDIIATENQLHGEDRRVYVFHPDKEHKITKVEARVLLEEGAKHIHFLEEDCTSYMKRGLKDIVDELDLQERISS